MAPETTSHMRNATGVITLHVCYDMGILHVCDFGKIGLNIGGGGVSRGLSLVY